MTAWRFWPLTARKTQSAQKKSNTASEESGALVSEAAEGEPEEKDILITLYSYLKGNAACSREGLDCILGKIS